MAGKTNGLRPFSVEGGTSDEAHESLTSRRRLDTAMGAQRKGLMKDMPQVPLACLVREGSQFQYLCNSECTVIGAHLIPFLLQERAPTEAKTCLYMHRKMGGKL